MKEVSPLQLIEKIERDSKWLQSNYIKIQEKHENEFIAIEEGKIIAHANEFETVIKKLKAQGKNPAHILIEFVPKKGIRIII